MFTLERGGESLALRPEGTPGAARAYIARSVHAEEPVTRWYYIGPMFRAEQPQRGRSRQFHQAGCELIGDAGPVVDAEMIDMLVELLRELGVTDVNARINSLGGPPARARYRQALLDFLRPKAGSLSEHARKRLEDNPLRILDSKDPRDREAVLGAPSILDALDAEDKAHFEGVRGALDALGTPYRVSPELVRGLDYYTRTVFEIESTMGELGSQNTLVAGGRYDNMLRELGGPNLPAIGFGMGLERVLLASPRVAAERPPSCFLAPIGPRATHAALSLARELRRRGVVAELDGRGNSLKSMLRRAGALGSRLCLLLGDAELEKGVVLLKDLEAHSQREVAMTEAVNEIVRELAG
jgi:histidyl-tRNA synthetase